jgi:hypothetical protein
MPWVGTDAATPSKISDQPQHDDDRNRDTNKPEQSTTKHNLVLLSCLPNERSATKEVPADVRDGRLTRSASLQELLYIFQRPALRLRYRAVDPDPAEDAEYAEQPEGSRLAELLRQRQEKLADEEG